MCEIELNWMWYNGIDLRAFFLTILFAFFMEMNVFLRLKSVDFAIM